MRGASGRTATAAMLGGLAALAVVGRLLPSTPSARGPATTAATVATSAAVIRTTTGNTRGYSVPAVLGYTLAQADRMLRPPACAAAPSSGTGRTTTPS